MAVVLVGCALLGGSDNAPARLCHGHDLKRLVAAVVEALPDAGVAVLKARRAPKRSEAVVRGVMTVRDAKPLALVLEVSVPQRCAVRVRVGAEPAERGPSLVEGEAALREEATRQRCPCKDPLVPLENRPRDNLRLRAESRQLIRACLAALDGRLREAGAVLAVAALVKPPPSHVRT